MKFKNWHCYYETHQMISHLNSVIMNGEDYNWRNVSTTDRKYYFELRYTIGDFERLPEFDKFKPEGCGVSVTGKRELPKAYLRGLLNIFKLCSFCANHGLEFDPEGLPF